MLFNTQKTNHSAQMITTVQLQTIPTSTPLMEHLLFTTLIRKTWEIVKVFTALAQSLVSQMEAKSLSISLVLHLPHQTTTSWKPTTLPTQWCTPVNPMRSPIFGSYRERLP